MSDPVPLNHSPFGPSSYHYYGDDEARWRAVQSRDADADGFFVYCVKTTKIFCRPTCKARLARRANVSFYTTGEEARRAGFRACKRCKPEALGLMPEEAAVRKIREFVRDRENGDDRMSLGQMAKQSGLSKWHFHRVFKKCVGVTPFEYLKMRRGGTSPSTPTTASSAMPWDTNDTLFDGDNNNNNNNENNGGETYWIQQTEADFDDFGLGFLDALSSTEGMGTNEDGDGGTTFAESGFSTLSKDTPFTLDDLLVWPDAPSDGYN